MSSVPDPRDREDAATADVAAIISRAATLGFSPTRVAVALGVSPSAQAAIERSTAPLQRRSSGQGSVPKNP